MQNLTNVLVIGTGGREHAICKSIKKSNKLGKLYCWGKNCNPGIYNLVDGIFYNSNMKKLKVIFKRYDIQLVIIGPEQNEDNSIADLCFNLNILCIGPTSNYGKIETNKKYARYILDELEPNVNPIYKFYGPKSNINEIKDFILELGEYVIKANGLKGGKGVKVSGDHLYSIDEALEYVSELNDEFFIIEEKFVGTEFSLMSFSDGEYLSHMPIVRDFKRAYDGDKGPNTGSMGSISYEDHKQPFLTNKDVRFCQKLNERVIHHLKNIWGGNGYKGIIYGSYMKTNNGDIKVIEFNSRFGDPECINVLECLETDLLEICLNIAKGTLNSLDITYKNNATVCRYLVPNGYPTKPVKNHEIYVDKRIDNERVIYSSVSYNDIIWNPDDDDSCSCAIVNNKDYMIQCGSRAIAIIGSGKNLTKANRILENNIDLITGPVFYRTDIGSQSGDIQSGDMYMQSGVDIDKGNNFVRQIEKYVTSTFNSSVLGNFGEFSGIYMLNEDNCLISSTDGVGTKSIFVKDYFGKEGFEGMGHDLVNHCTNDILVNGGIPLFFLDYYASSKLNLDEALYFVKGLSSACIYNNCVLIGGETAEMPDVYNTGRVDLVGTIVGNIDRNNIINGKERVKEGDIVLGIKSSGAHTNGFSLIRKIFGSLGTIEENLEKYREIIIKLCNPHMSYLSDIKLLLSNCIDIHALCHITGGGLIENPKRVLPDNLMISFDDCVYNYPEEFQFLKEKGHITDSEMMKVFNCGIGMLIITDLSFVEDILRIIGYNNDEKYIRKVGSVINKES